MGGRHALVIGSQCATLPQLSVLPQAAEELYEVMVNPERGGCVPALEPSGLVVDPTVAEAKGSIKSAFQRAHDDQATLLVAFIGHGEYVQNDDRVLSLRSVGAPGLFQRQIPWIPARN